MTGSTAGLLFANALYVAIGAALLPLLRIARSRDELVARLGLAPILGIAATGTVSAHLALIRIPVGLPELVLLTVVVGVFAWRRVRRLARRPPEPKPHRDRTETASNVVGAGALLAALALLANAARSYSVRPLVEWDGWAIWAMKARALYDFGGVAHGVFTTQPYGPLQHPLFFPALEATGFRSMGAFDGTLIHVQLAVLAFAFAVALWTLLRERVPAALAGATVLAIVAADSTLRQLASNLADIPLAFLVALGVVALARSLLEDDDTSLLPLAAVLLGAAALTKPEGLLFAAAALVAFVAIARTRASLLTALAVVLILLPWRVFVAVHGLKNPEYSFGDALDPSYLADRSERLRPALSGVWHQVWSSGWAWLVPFALAAFVACLLARRWRLAGFAAAWMLLSFAGIVLVFWISVVPVELTLRWAAYRIVASLVIGAAALAPLLAGEAWRTRVSEADG